MKLTERQKRRVADFLRGIAKDMGDLPEDERRDALQSLNQQIGRKLAALGAPDPSDGELERVLNQCHPNGLSSAEALPDEIVEDIAAASKQDEGRIWLGVCTAISEYLGLDTTLVRAFAVIVGVLTGPASIVLYLVLFAALDASGKLPWQPRIRWRHAAGFAGFTLGAAASLYVAARLLTGLLRTAYAQVSETPFHLLPYWGAVLDAQGRWFGWALVTLLPLAVLGSLPLAGGWDVTWRKVVKAGLAVYALALSIAIGSAFAAVIMALLEQLF